MTDPERRLAALRRWEEWLGGRLPDAGVERLDPGASGEGEARWRIAFPEGEPGRIHVTPPALSAEGPAFERLTNRLDQEDWRVALRGWRAIRIHEDGTVEELPTAGE